MVKGQSGGNLPDPNSQHCSSSQDNDQSCPPAIQQKVPEKFNFLFEEPSPDWDIEKSLKMDAAVS